MLLTELILSKRGPLAKVWLSAHHERKLSKQQALGVDVNESVGKYTSRLKPKNTPNAQMQSSKTQNPWPSACPDN